jgi:hypothetical protein
MTVAVAAEAVIEAAQQRMTRRMTSMSPMDMIYPSFRHMAEH